MNNLRKYRTDKLLTQAELSKMSGVSQVTISWTENDLNDPMPLTKAKLARALDVPVEELFPEEKR